MWQRGCFPPKTLIPPRRLHRIRGRYAALSTSVRCAYIQRRTRIGQVLFPFSKYAPGTTRFPVWITAPIKLTHYRIRTGMDSRRRLCLLAQHLIELFGRWLWRKNSGRLLTGCMQPGPIFGPSFSLCSFRPLFGKGPEYFNVIATY
jgi:hypothetical protein